MAVVIRLARHGQRNRPFYRIVAADKRFKRDGRFLKVVGYYNPLVDPPEIVLKEDIIRFYIENGAKPSKIVRKFITGKIPGLIEEKEKHQREKIRQKRKKRKAALKKNSTK